MKNPKNSSSYGQFYSQNAANIQNPIQIMFHCNLLSSMSIQLTPTFWLVNDGIGDSPIHSLLNHIHKQVIHNSSLSVPQKLLSWKTKCYTCLYVLVYCIYEVWTHEDIHLGQMYVIKYVRVSFTYWKESLPFLQDFVSSNGSNQLLKILKNWND